MQFHATPIAGLWEIDTVPRGDERGQLTRLFCEEALAEATGLRRRFVQSNITRTRHQGTVRGLHFQRQPAMEAKLVRCLQGRVFDVVVDLRAGSPSFGRWHGVELDARRERQLLVPEGCAHGFQTLSDEVQMFYQHSAPYSPERESGLRHDDPRLAIAWPLPVSQLSERDRAHALLDDCFEGLPV